MSWDPLLEKNAKVWLKKKWNCRFQGHAEEDKAIEEHLFSSPSLLPPTPPCTYGSRHKHEYFLTLYVASPCLKEYLYYVTNQKT